MPKHQYRETHINEEGEGIHYLYMYDEIVFTTKDKNVIHEILWNENGTMSDDKQIMEKVRQKIREGKGEGE
jgi:hypothetical protein